jgi:hypothetical protein
MCNEIFVVEVVKTLTHSAQMTDDRQTDRQTDRQQTYNVRFQVLTAASMKFRFVFWDVLHPPDDGGSMYL